MTLAEWCPDLDEVPFAPQSDAEDPPWVQEGPDPAPFDPGPGMEEIAAWVTLLPPGKLDPILRSN